MGVLDFRDAYEFDPETYAGEGSGLPGRLRRYAQQNGIDLGPTPGGPGKYNSDSFASPQGGLIGRLSALQVQQSQYQSVTGNGGQPASAPQNPNFTRGGEADLPRAGFAVVGAGANAGPIKRRRDDGPTWTSELE